MQLRDAARSIASAHNVPHLEGSELAKCQLNSIEPRFGNLVEAESPLAQTTNKYDAANRLIESTDANGNGVRYSYDAANRLLSRTVDPDGLALTTSYQYDAKGQQIATTDANGVVTTTSYDLNGQVVEQVVDPDGLALTTRYIYDQRGQVLTVTNAGGVVTQYVYDAQGRRIEEHLDPAEHRAHPHVARGICYHCGRRARYPGTKVDPVRVVNTLGHIAVTIVDVCGHAAGGLTK